MEGAPSALRFPLGIERVSDPQRLGIDFNHRPERRPRAIDLFDALEIQFHQPPRRVAPGLHVLLQLLERGFFKRERRLRLLPRRYDWRDTSDEDYYSQSADRS
jgi:hypothetical protein